jgi:hypothetical protein
MPADQCLGLDDRDGVYQARAEPVEPDECQSIGIGQPQAPQRTPPQYVHLMAENQILSLEPAARFHQRRQPTKQQSDHTKHGRE